MVYFDVSKEWVILLPPDAAGVKKAAGDLSRYIGLLAGSGGLSGGISGRGNHGAKAPVLADASGPAPPEEVPIIVLNSEGGGPERNGFSWRAGTERVEILGESGRGLCNGIYNFLAALGISWPAPGKENLPSQSIKTAQGFPLVSAGAYESSHRGRESTAPAPWRRFVPSGIKAAKQILSKSEAFAAWAARRRYDALILPLAVFTSAGSGRKIAELKKNIAEYGIALEAGGRDISSLLPGRYFFFHRDFFRMDDGRRVKDHHFCPTSPGAIKVLNKTAAKLFRAAGDIKVFHLWPDKGAETAWCSCPTCRAFSPEEQNRIAVNAAADILNSVSPGGLISYFEKPGEGGTIPLRRNLFVTERLPDEKQFPGG